MKKLSKELLMLLMATVFVVGCKSDDSKSEESESSDSTEYADVDLSDMELATPATINLSSDDLVFAAYLDLDNLVEKSGLNENQRKLLGVALASEIDDPTLQKLVSRSISDLDASGIKLSEPLYLTVHADVVDDEIVLEAVMMMQMSDADTLDEYTSALDADWEYNGDIRYISHSDEDLSITLGYNNDYLVFAATIDDYSYELFEAAMDNGNVDLSMFSGRDAAIYMNQTKVMNLLYPELANNEAYTSMIDSDVENLICLTFEPGRIVMDVQTTGGNESLKRIYDTIDTENLKYIAGDAVGFMGIGINGEAFVEVMEEILTEDMERTLAKNAGISRNDLVTTLEIVYSAIGSIDGGINLALNDIRISTNYTYDDFGDYVPETTVDAEATLLANVSNNFFMDNISMLGNMAKKVSDNQYRINYGKNTINIGQEDNLFRIGLNAPCNDTPAVNMADKWASKFENSIMYFAVDVQNFAASKIGRDILREAKSDLTYDQRTFVDNAVEMLDSFWINVNADYRGEIVLSFDDTETNALQQIVALFINAANN